MLLVTIVKLIFFSSSINSSSFTTFSSIISTSTNIISTYNLIRIAYHLYSFVIDTNSIAISRKVIITVDYIASNHPQSKIKSTRVNVIELSFSTY